MTDHALVQIEGCRHPDPCPCEWPDLDGRREQVDFEHLALVTTVDNSIFEGERLFAAVIAYRQSGHVTLLGGGARRFTTAKELHSLIEDAERVAGEINRGIAGAVSAALEADRLGNEAGSGMPVPGPVKDSTHESDGEAA